MYTKEPLPNPICRRKAKPTGPGPVESAFKVSAYSGEWSMKQIWVIIEEYDDSFVSLNGFFFPCHPLPRLVSQPSYSVWRAAMHKMLLSRAPINHYNNVVDRGAFADLIYFFLYRRKKVWRIYFASKSYFRWGILNHG